jgi:predicted phage terminase large subunit-like protein
MKPVSKELLTTWRERVELTKSTEFTVNFDRKESELRKERARRDYSYFVKTYFPHYAKTECAPFHLEAANYVLKYPTTRAVFEWARGHAKSSHLTMMIPLWLKIQEPRQINFVVVVGKSNDNAVRLLMNLQAELETNKLFVHDYGEQVKSGDWAEGEFHTTDGCMFIAKGRGQSPRGLLDRANRPDYIVIDDIDDDEMCRNPKRVDDAFEWTLTALIGAMDMGRGRFILVGNRIAKHSVLTLMSERPGVFHTVVNALDKRGNPSWSAKYSRQEIAKMRELIGERRFMKEYMNSPVTEGTVFASKDIRYVKMADIKSYRSLICYTDPSFKSSATADYKATMLCGRTRDGYIHLLKAYAAVCTVSQMIRWHYEIDNYINGRAPIMYYMEANFIQDLLMDEFRKAGEILGRHIPVRADKRKKPDKFARIEAMQPMFERGLILFNEDERKNEGMQTLVEQLMAFAKGSRAHDDAPDALEGAVWMLSQKMRTSQTSIINVGNSRTSWKF